MLTAPKPRCVGAAKLPEDVRSPSRPLPPVGPDDQVPILLRVVDYRRHRLVGGGGSAADPEAGSDPSSIDREQLLRADAEARRLAHTEFERPLVVDAGAGTGKTGLLTARVVAWLLGQGWQRHAADGDNPARRAIERVVAITFTEAAAAEMAERVAEALSELARGGDPPPGIDADLVEVAGDERAERAAALADEVHRLQAQTDRCRCRKEHKSLKIPERFQ